MQQEIQHDYVNCQTIMDEYWNSFFY